MSDSTTEKLPGVLFVSSITLSEKDNPTEAKKWNRFSSMTPTYVICFSKNGFGHENRHGVDFYTYSSKLPLLFRLLFYYGITPFLVTYLTLRYSASVWIAQSPYEAGAAWLPCLLLKPLSGAKLIVEAHGDWIESFLELRNVPLRSMFEKSLKLYSKIILWQADGFRSVSSKTKQLLNEHSSNNRPHQIFPTFTDLDIFLDTSVEEKQTTEGEDILYVGALTHLKGVKDLLKAIQLCEQDGDEIPLQIIGDGPQRSYFEEYSEDIKISEHVSFSGNLPQEAVKEAYVRSRMLILPSHTEGMPRVLIESLACYTPFISTENPGGKELASKSDGGIVVPIKAPEKLAQKISRLYHNEDERRELGKSGRKYVEEHYSVDAYFENYRELISEVIDRS